MSLNVAGVACRDASTIQVEVAVLRAGNFDAEGVTHSPRQSLSRIGPTVNEAGALHDEGLPAWSHVRTTQ